MQTPISTLCLDDDSLVLEMLKELLEAEGHNVFATTSVHEARNALESGFPFTYCLCDYEMPEMLGDDFLRLVAAKSPDTIRVLISGYADNKRIHQAKVNNVCSTFIQKPFRVAELISILDIHRHAKMQSKYTAELLGEFC
jgi:DNA-binding NtrC family response regulator